MTRGRRCASIVISGRIDVLRQCDHSPFNAAIDRLLAAAGGCLSGRRHGHTRRGWWTLRSAGQPTNQPPPPPPTTSSPSHPLRQVAQRRRMRSAEARKFSTTDFKLKAPIGNIYQLVIIFQFSQHIHR